MIVFENCGEIDAASISTFGISVKESENPIGFFGTGLKYAIAILLRHGQEVTILSGMSEFKFGVQKDFVRGKEFSFVTMSDSGHDPFRLGFTTEVGKTWDLWMAYRELFCNARDENGYVTATLTPPDPALDRTYVIVVGAAFETIHADYWKYFVEGEPDLTIGTMQIWRRASDAFFYRGVRVLGWQREAMLTYSETGHIELTEDRTLKNTYDAHLKVISAVLRMTDKALIKSIITAPARVFEHGLDFHGWGPPASPEFLDTVGRTVNDGVTDVNETAKKVWEEQRPKEFNPRLTELTSVQARTLERALDFCGKIGFTVRGVFPVVVVESLGQDTLGMAKNGTIYVAERAFHMGGAKQVATVLIEEWAHLRYSYKDCTRAMQNWLFERMVSLGEELTGEPL